MHKDIAVSVRNVTKEYRVFGSPAKRALSAFGAPVKHKTFTALDEVSVDFPKGEVVAILGKNGSGKSTLLKIITGVIQPTTGAVEVDGRISAILELTSGFDRELTGIENIYLKALTRGLTRSEIEGKVAEIVAFADIGDHINQPVRTYSSGMKSRLGFAVAVSADPDILIIDEALSVGDEVFKMKCIDRMSQFRAEGKTILFVSHSLSTVRGFCTQGIWINQGKVVAAGDLGSVANEYQNFLKSERARVRTEMRDKAADQEQRALARADIFYCKGFNFVDAPEGQAFSMEHGSDLRVRFCYNVKMDTSPLYLGLGITDAGGHTVFQLDQQRYLLPNSVGTHTVDVTFPNLILLPGDYFVSGQVWENESSLRAPFATNKRFQVVSTDYRGEGTTYLNHCIAVDGQPACEAERSEPRIHIPEDDD